MASAGHPLNVLFLCTGNSARSIMAESILRREGADRINAFSAGSHPTGSVNRRAIALLQGVGYPTEGLRSKAWDEFAAPGAPPLDVVITVCDNARGEICPVWPGHPATAHWGVPDPAAVDGTEDIRRAAFERAFRLLLARIRPFTRLPFDTLDGPSLTARLRATGDAT